MSAETKRWCPPTEPALRWREWGGLFVVFNPASGDTHLLNATAAEVLRALEARASTLDELLAEISRRRGAPLGDPLSKNIEALLEELDELGLVTPARS